jgi:hypothetical protein
LCTSRPASATRDGIRDVPHPGGCCHPERNEGPPGFLGAVPPDLPPVTDRGPSPRMAPGARAFHYMQPIAYLDSRHLSGPVPRVTRTSLPYRPPYSLVVHRLCVGYCDDSVRRLFLGRGRWCQSVLPSSLVKAVNKRTRQPMNPRAAKRRQLTSFDPSPAARLQRLKIAQLATGPLIIVCGFEHPWFFLLLLPLFVFGWLRVRAIRCPECRSRVFVRHGIYSPSRECFACGHDLRAA